MNKWKYLYVEYDATKKYEQKKWRILITKAAKNTLQLNEMKKTVFARQYDCIILRLEFVVRFSFGINE